MWLKGSQPPQQIHQHMGNPANVGDPPPPPTQNHSLSQNNTYRSSPSNQQQVPSPPTQWNQPNSQWYQQQTHHQNVPHPTQFQQQTTQLPNFYTNNHSVTNAVPASSAQNYPSTTMTSQYFENNANTGDGWTDDWGEDFNDDNNVVQPTVPTANRHVSSPNQNSVYQQHQQPPPSMVHQTVDGWNVTAQQQQNFNSPYVPSQMVHQQHQQQPPMHLPSSHSPAPVNKSMYQPPPPQHPPSQQPVYFQQPGYQPQNGNYQQMPTDNNSWNWNAGGNIPSGAAASNVNEPENYTPSAMNPDELFPKVNRAALTGHNRNISNASSTATNTSQNMAGSDHDSRDPQFRQPDELKNTQAGNVRENPLLSRVKRTEPLLTPQWSIESQMSSSDRSIESDNLDTRSSATTSDDPMIAMSENNQHVNAYDDNSFRGVASPPQQQQQQHFGGKGNHVIGEASGGGNDLDSLDQALMTMNVSGTDRVGKTSPTGEVNNVYGQEIHQFPTNSPTALPPKTQPIVTHGIPPPMMTAVPPSASRSPVPIGGPPPATQTAPNVAGNPFKRAGQPTHRNAHSFQQPTTTTTVMPPTTNFYLPETSINQETLQPDNIEIPELHHPENLEIAPTNERNQYLQTGHLSEEGSGHLVGDGSESVPPPPPQNEAIDNLPPPGLSRYVLGQPESEIDLVCLNRMIPGTELTAATRAEVNLARQADGQAASMSPPNTTNRIPDRNLYQVPGESNASNVQSLPQSQRVVPGVEHDRRIVQPPLDITEIPIADQQRELVMDGENVDDRPIPPPSQQHQQQQQSELITRDEPIEGANTADDQPVSISTQQGREHVESDSKNSYDGVRKNVMSNPSTANDDSDKDRYYGGGRRSEDGGVSSSVRKQRRDKPRGEKERYDTEESEYYSDRDRGRRYGREGSVKDGRGERERDRDKDRPVREKRDRDRYDRGGDRDKDRYYRDRYDRDRGTRYETDGSKYDSENREEQRRRRYERDEYERRRRGDRGDRDEDRSSTKYRTRDPRDERRRDDRYRPESDRDRKDRPKRDRRYDYDEYHRSGSRNERDLDGKDRRYPLSQQHQQSYYGAGGYNYDAYAYYQQHQQYYETLRRTNPQAYAEWYRKYYSQMSQAQLNPVELVNTDGRESVHSGRSSANEKERYTNSRQQFYHQPSLLPPTTAHHTMPHNSTAYMDQSYLSGISGMGGVGSGGPTSMSSVGHQNASYLMASRSYYTHSEFSESRVDALDSSLQLDGGPLSSTVQSNRMTPCKFTNDHCLATITSGLMVCLKPSRYFTSSNGNISTIKIVNLTVNDSTRRLFTAFPGPLVRGITHKKTVIEFCEDQIRHGPPSLAVRSRGNSVSSVNSMTAANRSSFTLMWNLLILLLRQNGMVVGTDISELLLRNQVEFPYDVVTINKHQRLGSVQSGRNSVQSESRRSRENETPSDENSPADDLSDEVRDQSEDRDTKEGTPATEEEAIIKFRNYLLYGNMNEALDWATDNNLWGHALFLASKVDRRAHANVMMKFANKLALNDPLQTLFQLMSGKVPSSVTSVQDEKWGDWRSHLAMILSNTSQKPELDRKAITTLGDSLYNRGDLFGAQFCYLMSQVGFGKYSAVNQDSALMFNSANTIRLILLGSSHHKTFREFATSDAIIMTEIYEYACTLNDDKFSIVEFQPYKYLLATRMLDYGLHFKTLMYMEQIASHIEKDPSKYGVDFMEKIFVLGDRLKYYDPALEKTLDELTNDGDMSVIEDQKWLVSLRGLISNSNQNNNYYTRDSVSQPSTQYDNNQLGYDANDLSYQQNYQQQDLMKQQIDQQFQEINQQFSELNMQYSGTESGGQYLQPTVPSAGTDMSGGYNHGYDPQLHQPPQQFQGEIAGHDHTQQLQSSPGDGQQLDYYGQQQQQQQQPQQSYGQQPGVDNYGQPQTQGGYDYWNQTQSNEQQPNNVPPSPSTPITKKPIQTDNKKEPETLSKSKDGVEMKQSQQQKSLTNTTTKSSPSKSFPPTQPSNVANNPYSYIQPSADMPKPQISMPNSMSNKPGFYDDANTDDVTTPHSTDSKLSNNLAPSSKKDGGSGDKSDAKNNKNRSGGQSGANSGWFGGIWNKLSLKPKNQMILPDDKNPSIVWDPDKKKWVNTDGGEAEAEQFKPPPKMGDMNTQMGMHPPQQQQQQPPPPQHQQQQPPSSMSSNVPSFNQSTNQQPSSIPTTDAQHNNGGLPNMTAVDPNKVPNLQSNMFKMQRNRTLKKSYVDVFNPSGAPTKSAENVMAPVSNLPPVPQGGFFIPGAPPAGEPQSQSDGQPQFYNPNQYSGYQQ